MLLRNLSHTARTRVDRANRAAQETPRQRPAPEVLAPVGQDAFDPTSLGELPPNFISRVVSAQDHLPERTRHNAGYMHLSALLKEVCPRQIRLSDLNADRAVYQDATGGHRVMWKLGRAVEAHVRESFIKGVQGKGVYGAWSCQCGRTREEGLFSSEWPRCRSCGEPPVRYGELTIFDHNAGISGSPDFPIMINRLLHVGEIKSMNGEEFDSLTQPIPDHVFQAAGYRRLFSLNGMPVSDKVLIHYTTKKFKFGSPYKEFHVNVNTAEINRVLDGVWARALEIKQHRLEGTLPPRTMCQSTSATKARKCPHVTDCFSRSC